MPGVLFYLLLALLPVPQDSAPQKPAGQTTCQIQGMIVEQEDGTPIKNARAFLEPDQGSVSHQEYVVKTGAEGRFCFTQVEAGRYHLVAAHNGHLTQRYGAEDFWSQGMALSLEKDQKLDPMLLRLVRASVISGKILDEDDEPAPGIVVQALVPTDLAYALLLEQDEEVLEHNRLVTAQITRTNDLGEYRLAGLPPGVYIVKAQKSDGEFLGNAVLQSAPDGSSGQRLPTFYPGTVRRGEAQAIEVTIGQDVTASFQLAHERTVSVSGTVVGQDGKPAGRLYVHLEPGQMDGNNYAQLGAQSDADGNFKIENVLSGSYIAQAWGMSEKTKAETRQYAQQSIEVGAEDVKTVRLLLKRGVTVAARIAADGGALPDVTRLHVYLIGVGDASSSGSNKIDKDGNFTLPGVIPGAYKVQIPGLPESYYLKRLTYGGTRRSDSKVVIEDGAASDKIELLVSPHAASIAGAVKDGNDSVVGGMLVVLQNRGSKQGEQEIREVTSSDQNGQFSFHGLAPGDYTLVLRKRLTDPLAQPAHLDVHLVESEQKLVTVKAE